MGFQFWRPKQRNAELDEELRAHLTRAEDDAAKSGKTTRGVAPPAWIQM
jgi:hypothetical protein